jgi:hypothetical protein
VSSATRTAVARMYQQLRVIEHQPAEANPLGSVLGALVKQLTTLTSIRLTAQPGLSVQISTGSVPPAASLVKRIQALRHLLAGLARINPAYARRLAPTLTLLQSLLAKLLSMQHHANPLSPVPAGPTSDAVRAPITSWPGRVGTWVAATGTVTSAVPMSLHSTGTLGRVRSQLVSGSERRLRQNPPSASTTSGRTGLPVAALPAGGSSPSIGAPGSWAGTGAGTLATTLVVILLLGLLSGRLGLVVLLRRPAVLRPRLERPG